LQKIVRNALPEGGKIFDIGCGNGAIAGLLSDMGYQVTGVDPSETGIGIASKSHPDCIFKIGSAYDDLASEFGNFPVVISLEVIEHCYWPRKFAKSAFDLVKPGGIVVISTPYHGYLKNLLLALLNKMDFHWSPLWDGGHIKFFSRKTLFLLLTEIGFEKIEFLRIGRFGPIAKSMIAIAHKPSMNLAGNIHE
jgi:2-polyprenyl-6-hydroxyphenyl methylase/3-demethylubiquinone-9 3-methyltransferase